MNHNFPCPSELAVTLAELRARGRISDADNDLYRKRLLGGEAESVHLEFYRKQIISSRRFNAIERAIERDRVLEAATSGMNPWTDFPKQGGSFR